MSEAITTLVAHVNRTLPDSLTERRKVLGAMLELMTPKHPAYNDVNSQLGAVQSAIDFQAKAQIHFQNLLK